MKVLINTCILLLLGCTSYAQKSNAFYDAVTLREKAQNGKILANKEVLQVLYNYENKGQTTVDANTVQQAYQNNPFIAPYLVADANLNEQIVKQSYGQRGVVSDAPKASNGLGLSPSTLLLGLADFLVQRTKQELHIAFFKEFNKQVKKSEELRILFPQTKETLLAIEEDIYRFTAFWEAIRESFTEDLRNLPEHLADYFQESEKIKDPKVRALAGDCFEVIDMLKRKNSPTDIIRYLNKGALFQELKFEDKSMQQLQNNLQLVGLFSEGLEYMDDSKYWVSPEKFNGLLRDSMQADLFLGLIYQKGKHISLGKQTLGQHMEAMRGDLTQLRLFLRTIKNFIEDGQELYTQVQDIRRIERNSSRGNGLVLSPQEKHLNFYTYADKAIKMVDYAFEIKRQLTGVQQRVDTAYHRYISVIKDVNKLIYDVHDGKYPVAIISAIGIINKLLPDGELKCACSQVMKYGSFIAMAIRAKTPKEVSRAIEAFALPPGSSAIKKFSNFSVSLNAYVGASGGMEFLSGLGAKPFYAIATPIGIAANWGFKDAGSISILASIIDIGALTAFRFSDTGNAGDNPLPNLKFENVLAPGAYVVYGVPKYPLSIGIGAQMGPHLRTVRDNGGLLMQTNGWRLGAFIAVDIPIVNLFTTSKKYKVCKKAK